MYRTKSIGNKRKEMKKVRESRLLDKNKHLYEKNYIFIVDVDRWDGGTGNHWRWKHTMELFTYQMMHVDCTDNRCVECLGL